MSILPTLRTFAVSMSLTVVVFSSAHAADPKQKIPDKMDKEISQNLTLLKKLGVPKEFLEYTDDDITHSDTSSNFLDADVRLNKSNKVSKYFNRHPGCLVESSVLTLDILEKVSKYAENYQGERIRFESVEIKEGSSRLSRHLDGTEFFLTDVGVSARIDASGLALKAPLPVTIDLYKEIEKSQPIRGFRHGTVLYDHIPNVINFQSCRRDLGAAGKGKAIYDCTFDFRLWVRGPIKAPPEPASHLTQENLRNISLNASSDFKKCVSKKITLVQPPQLFDSLGILEATLIESLESKSSTQGAVNEESNDAGIPAATPAQ